MEIRVKRVMLSDDELMHYRTKGSKNGQRLYQNKDGSLTPLGRIHYGVGKARGEGDSDGNEGDKRRSIGQVLKDRKKAKVRKESLEKARAAKAAKQAAAKKAEEEAKLKSEEEAKKKAEEEKAKAEREEAKQKAIMSGSASEVLKFQGELTGPEMQFIQNRINWEANMKKAAKDEETTKAKEFFEKLDTATSYAETGIKAWNTVANVVNAWNGEKVMPKVSTNIQNDNKQQVINRKRQLQAQKARDEAQRQQQQAYEQAQAEAAKQNKKNKKSKDQNQQKTNNQNQQGTDTKDKGSVFDKLKNKTKSNNSGSENNQNPNQNKQNQNNQKSNKRKFDAQTNESAEKVTKSETKVSDVSKDVIDAGYSWLYDSNGEFIRMVYDDLKHADFDDIDADFVAHCEMMADFFLSHHGVKGQKWGVRRYQDKNGRLTAAGKQHLKDRKIDAKIEEYVKSGKAKVEELENYTVAGLTTMTRPSGEQYVSGLMEGHDFDWQEVTNYSDLGGYYTTASVIKNKPNSHRYVDGDPIYETHDNFQIASYDMKRCNPNFGQPGTTQNCAKCSATLELRMRGDYDISAGRQTYPSSADAMSYWFKDAKRVDYDYDTVEDALRSYGKKTSGTLGYQYATGGGHSVHWTNDAFGNFQIQDGQNGRTFNSVSELMDAYGGDTTKTLSTFRLDNCEPDWDALESDSVVSKRYGSYSKVRNKWSNRVVDTW